jgi:hypothetical protein
MNSLLFKLLMPPLKLLLRLPLLPLSQSQVPLLPPHLLLPLHLPQWLLPQQILPSLPLLQLLLQLK